MLQAIGLTGAPRRDLPPAVDNLSFELAPGTVTALHGPPGCGSTEVLRLMLDLDPGRGLTAYGGRPLHRVEHPAREVGAVLGDVPGHPSRTVRGQLRMACAAVGVPAARADAVLRAVGAGALRDRRLGVLPRAADRRVGLAAALLADPRVLLLDRPTAGLTPREQVSLHALLRAHARRGGIVLFATEDPREAARFADRVLALDSGRLVADVSAAEFARTRLRPRVVVRTPYAARLAELLDREARAGRRTVEVVREGGSRLSVYGGSCAEVGDVAFRHGVLVHRLADEVGAEPRPAPAPVVVVAGPDPEPEGARGRHRRPAASRAPGVVAVAPPTGPARPWRCELRRVFGVPGPWLVLALTLLGSALAALLAARTAGTPVAQAVSGRPDWLPLPPTALGAGLLGAAAFGEEHRHPTLGAELGLSGRRLGTLLAKTGIATGIAVGLVLTAAALDLGLLALVWGEALDLPPADGPAALAGWLALSVGCAWAGLLAGAVFRATAAGFAAVLAIPVLVVPACRALLAGPALRPAPGLAHRLREVGLGHWPAPWEGAPEQLARALAHPVGAAVFVSLLALICVYGIIGLRGRARW
ncbi:ATP-binding cassette domain-containing protein [Streptomyces sp. BI20]|uniref:ATP-binding cassette domain-containing protein n=1 Tax=Streptomyces sp. BI20 TaxID=3403460 RepID=UPI003C75A7D1